MQRPLDDDHFMKVFLIGNDYPCPHVGTQNYGKQCELLTGRLNMLIVSLKDLVSEESCGFIRSSQSLSAEGHHVASQYSPNSASAS